MAELAAGLPCPVIPTRTPQAAAHVRPTKQAAHLDDQSSAGNMRFVRYARGRKMTRMKLARAAAGQR